jgi:hypothetical protein
MLADLDEEAERYYAQAPSADLVDAPADGGFDLEAALGEAPARMAAFERSLHSGPVVFHSKFSEEFVGLDEELQLPPRLRPNETVSAMQVARLIDKFASTTHKRSAEDNERMLDQVVALINRIVIRVGLPIPPPSQLPSTTTYEDPLLNERYAEHVVHRCVWVLCVRWCVCVCVCHSLTFSCVCVCVCGVCVCGVCVCVCGAREGRTSPLATPSATGASC